MGPPAWRRVTNWYMIACHYATGGVLGDRRRALGVRARCGCKSRTSPPIGAIESELTPLTPEPKYGPPPGEKVPNREVVGFTTKTPPANCRS